MKREDKSTESELEEDSGISSGRIDDFSTYDKIQSTEINRHRAVIMRTGN